MAYKNKIIVNPITKQEIRFLQTAGETNGQLLEMESTLNAYSKEPAPHYHPRQKEDFTVLSGELNVRLDGKIIVLKKGDTLHIPPYKVHSMWNNTGGKTVLNWKVQPALNTENLFETAMGLAVDGKTNEDGMPNILQAALMANQFDVVFRLSKPPFIIQKMLFILLTPLAYLMGYRPTYNKYLD